MSDKIINAKRDKEETMTVWQEIIKTGDVQAVRDHIAAGADVNAKDDYGNTLADWAKRGETLSKLFPDLP